MANLRGMGIALWPRWQEYELFRRHPKWRVQYHAGRDYRLSSRAKAGAVRVSWDLL